MGDTKLELNILQSYTSTVYDRPGCGYTQITSRLTVVKTDGSRVEQVLHTPSPPVTPLL